MAQFHKLHNNRKHTTYRVEWTDLCNEEGHLVAVKLICDIAFDVNVRHFDPGFTDGCVCSVSKELEYSARRFVAAFVDFSLCGHARSSEHC